jgi:hypothetical protein
VVASVEDVTDTQAQEIQACVESHGGEYQRKANIWTTHLVSGSHQKNPCSISISWIWDSVIIDYLVPTTSYTAGPIYQANHLGTVPESLIPYVESCIWHYGNPEAIQRIGDDFFNLPFSIYRYMVDAGIPSREYVALLRAVGQENVVMGSSDNICEEDLISSGATGMW